MPALLQHLIRIMSLSALFVLQKKYVPITDNLFLQEFLGIFLFSALLYAVGRWLLIRSFTTTPKWENTLCFMPLLLVICSYYSTPWISTLAYFASLPLCILLYFSFHSRYKSINIYTFSKIGIVVFLWMNFITYLLLGTPFYDVWQLYDLSQHLIQNHSYETNYIRAVQYNTTQGYSFPFLYPVFLAITDFFTGLGIRSFILLNYAACACIVLAIRATCNMLRQGHKWGLISWCLFIVYKMPSEVNGGGTTPFTLLVLVLLVLFLLNISIRKELITDSANSYKVAILFSSLLGLGCGVRFDFLPISLLLLLAWSIYFLYRRNVKLVLYSVGIFICWLLPWSIYSYVHFDHFYIMDNSRRIFFIPETDISTYHADISAVKTIFTHPYEWALVKGTRFLEMVTEFLLFVLITPAFLFLPAIALYQSIKKKSVKMPDKFTFLVLFLLILTSFYLPILFLTGYLHCERYYLPFTGLVIFVSSLYISLPDFKLSYKTKIFFFSCLGAVVVLASTLLVLKVIRIPKQMNKIVTIYQDLKLLKSHSIDPVKLSEHEEQIRDYINMESEDNRRLLAHRVPFKPFYLPRFSLSTDIICVPDLSQPNSSIELIRDFDASFLYSDNEWYINTLKKLGAKQEIMIIETPIPNLYKINK